MVLPVWALRNAVCEILVFLLFQWLSVMLIAFGSHLSTAQNSTTYMHFESSTGQTLECERCKPGYHLVEHCTTTHPTKCALCEDGLYTACWNYVNECLMCDTCYENQVISQPCSPSQNTKCVCQDGYFWNRYYCKRHKVCSSGYGVKRKGKVKDMGTSCDVATVQPFTC